MAKYIDLPNLKENLTNFLNKKINPIYAKKTEIPSNVSELNNDKSYQTAEEVGKAVTDGVARIVAGAPEDFDTLKEMSDWISSHETSAAAMNSAISDNSVAIANHTSNSDIHVTKEEKTKWNKLDSDLKDGTIIVAEATKATQDAQGNVIDTTYAKKTEVPQGTVVDDALSSTSTNPVQNKVVKAEFDNVNSNLSDSENASNYGNVPLRIIKNSYYDKTNGSALPYDGWSRAELIKCKGVKTLNIKCSVGSTYNVFLNDNKQFVSSFTITEGKNVISVPFSACYVGFSGKNDNMDSIVVDNFKLGEINESLDCLAYGENGAKNIYDISKANFVIGAFTSTGGDNAWGDYIKDSQYTEVEPNTRYSVSNSENANFSNGILFYDANKTFLSWNIYVANGGNFTTPSNAKYIRFALQTKNKPTWIQIEKGNIVSEHKPYIPSVKMLAEENAQQSTEMMDIKMLGWSVPKECHVQNEVSGNQFVQKVGRYNLWEFSWGFVPKEDAWGAPYYYCYLSGGLLPKMPDSHDGVPNMFCQKYKVVSWNAMGSGIDDTICLIYTSNSIRIKDTTYTNLADFKQAMQGQYLYYELATPITKTIDGNEKAEQIDDSLTSLGKCKNLLKPTLQTTTQNGITCTDNGDGTYTLSGKKTADTIWLLLGTVSLKANTSYKLIAQSSTDASTDVRVYDNDGIYFGDGTYRGATPIITPATNITLNMQIRIAEATLDNFVVKPMLTTNLNATYDDFVPYTGNGDTLTADVAELKNDLSDLKDGTTPVAKAVADEDGNNIKSTYAKKTELDTKANIADPVFTGSFSQNRKAGSTIGTNSHAEGEFPVASGNNSHAEGTGTEASGEGSHSEGEFTIASGMGSHAEGASTIASGERSHAEGSSTEASGEGSHAEGASTIASGISSHSEGAFTKASGKGSHAEGASTEASNFSSHSSGKYNASMITGGTSNNTTGTAFVIGNGTSSSSRSNAFSVQYDGTVKAKSTITASTTADYAEFFEWLDENPNNEDRVGYFVTLDGNRIKIASDNDDYILGIVSGEPFVLGNGDCDTWNGMYLHDEFRRTIYEPAPKVEEIEIKEEREETYIDEETGEEKTRTVEVVVGHEFKEVEGEFEGTRPKLNPEYDHTQQYISRFDRKEWSPVGMLGVLAVRHDGTAKVNGYVTVNKDGIATACDRNIENSYRVIKANTDSVVEVIFK